MILQALCEYYDRKRDELAPIGFEEKEIPFIVVLDREGRFIQLMDTRESDGNTKPKARMFTVPQAPGRQGSKSYAIAYCLWDHYGYVLNQPKIEKPGTEPAQKDVEMAAKQHAAFSSVVENLRHDLPDDTGVLAVHKFLKNDSEKDKLKNSQEWLECLKIKGCNLSFKLIDDEFLVCQSSFVRDWVTANLLSESEEGTCLVTGEQGSVARLHSVIKGVWGAQVAGASMVSFNFNSFESWNKAQGANSPVSEKAVFEYTTALNYLLRSDCPNRFQMGEVSVVCWSQKSSDLERVLPTLFKDPSSDSPDDGIGAVTEVFRSLHNGAYMDMDGQQRFYVLGLSPNASRIAVRFWQVGTVAEISERIGQWFEDINIVKSERFAPPTVKALLRSTALLGKDENVPPHLIGETVRTILAGLPLPVSAFQAVIKRIKAEKGAVTFYRASLIKAYLNRHLLNKNQSERTITVAYNPEEKRIGYRLGCLFAVLEKLQKDANPGLNATIRDRYYSSASCTPKSVFGTLMRLHTHHLKKLDNPAWKTNTEKRIGEILADVEEFPSHLNLDDQGLFAIGYYHQQQALYTKKETVEGESA